MSGGGERTVPSINIRNLSSTAPADLIPGTRIEGVHTHDQLKSVMKSLAAVLGKKHPDLVRNPSDVEYLSPSGEFAGGGVNGALREMVRLHEVSTGTLHIDGYELVIAQPPADSQTIYSAGEPYSLWPEVTFDTHVGKEAVTQRGTVLFQMYPDAFEAEPKDLTYGVWVRPVSADVGNIAHAIAEYVEPSAQRAREAESEAMRRSFRAGAPGLGKRS